MSFPQVRLLVSCRLERLSETSPSLVCFFVSLVLRDFFCFLCALTRCMSSFHGVDLSSLRNAASDEYFRQPVVVS